MKKKWKGAAAMQELHHLPAPGEFYRHHKGSLYQILAIAIHTETEEPLVVYQALYGEFQVFARPLSLFLGKTEDGEKRFVKTEVKNAVSVPETADDSIGGGKTSEEETAAALPAEQREATEEAASGKQDFYERMEKFYDADSYEAKLEYLFALRDDLNEIALANIALSLDIAVPEGSLEERFQSIVSCLKTMKKYQGNRLR